MRLDNGLFDRASAWSGKYAYVTSAGAGMVSQYTIGPDGSLAAMATASVLAGSLPTAIATVGSYQQQK